MNKKVTSEASDNAKDKFIETILKSANDVSINKMDHIIMIRGEKSMLVHGDILDVIENQNTTASLAKMIKFSEESKNSRHQIDYIIFTKMTILRKEKFQSKDIPEKYKSVEGMQKFYDKIYKEHTDEIINSNKALILIIMSKEGIDLLSYDIIESIDKKDKSLSRVISPVPEIVKCMSNPDEEGNKGTMIIFAGKPVPNIFEKEIIDIFSKYKLGIPDEEIEESFKYDYKWYKEKSEFIKERDERLSLNQE